jgi:DNA adenine methylase
MFYSPLRYPGGKNKLAKCIAMLCETNNIKGHYVEPYAGGASVALHLLLEKKVSKITINDFDRSIYAFWYSVLNYTEELCGLIDGVEITIGNWHKAKKIQENKKNASLFELGFSTLFLNRTNRSGILNAGLIGGQKQDGLYKMDCRFNKKSLIEKIKKIAENKKNITVSNLDAIDLIKKLKKNKSTIFYFDPPYYFKGSSLYEHHYHHENHEEVAKMIRKIKNAKWVISYDNTPEIKKIYNWVNKKIEYSFFHTAHTSKPGKEILFFSDNLNFNKGLNPLKPC